MLTLKPDKNIEVSVRPPLIYLDHCAVRGIASDATRREHLLKTFETRGTLMFSVLNVVEIGQNSGASYTQIRDLLDALEPYWLLSDHDAGTVWNKEQQGLVAPESFFAPLALFGVLYKNMPAGTLRLGTALEAVQGEEFRNRTKKWLEPKKLVQQLRTGREDLRRGVARLQPPPGPKGNPIWIQVSLSQHLVKDGKKIVTNDAIDLLHASVPLRYCTTVVFDKAWANFARKLGLPDIQIFSVSELDAALEAIRTIDVSRHRVVRPEVERFMERPIPPGGLPL